MNKVYVLIKADGDDVEVKVYKDKYLAVEYAMEYCYGEDWEIQANDPEWDDSAEISSNYESLLHGYGFTDAEDVVWSVEETELIG